MANDVTRDPEAKLRLIDEALEDANERARRLVAGRSDDGAPPR